MSLCGAFDKQFAACLMAIDPVIDVQSVHADVLKSRYARGANRACCQDFATIAAARWTSNHHAGSISMCRRATKHGRLWLPWRLRILSWNFVIAAAVAHPTTADHLATLARIRAAQSVAARMTPSPPSFDRFRLINRPPFVKAAIFGS